MQQQEKSGYIRLLGGPREKPAKTGGFLNDRTKICETNGILNSLSRFMVLAEGKTTLACVDAEGKVQRVPEYMNMG